MKLKHRYKPSKKNGNFWRNTMRSFFTPSKKRTDYDAEKTIQEREVPYGYTK